MSEVTGRDFGRLESEVKALQEQMKEMAADMKAIRATLDSASGSWRILVGLGVVVGFITNLLANMVPNWFR